MKVIDLFSGCGGMSLGFQNAGFEIVAAFDNWEPAINVYSKNFKHQIVKCDLGKLNNNFEQFIEFYPDMIIGGPPCQDFSHAGKRNEELGRADLTITFAQIVANVKPRFFIMENVGRTANSKKFAIAKDILKNAGFGLTQRILDASYCGVPQRRKRLFLLGAINESDDFAGHYLDSNLEKNPLTVREYFEKILKIELEVKCYYRHPRNYSRRAIYGIDEPSATIRGVNRPLPANYPGHPSDAAEPSEKIRPLTTIERSYIQTFPPNFIFSGTKSDLEQMIGNAVPVKLAEYVSRCFLDYFNNGISISDKTGYQMELFEC